MESRKSSRRSSSRREETADERLDQLLERERAASKRQVSEPVTREGQLAVRSVRVEATEESRRERKAIGVGGSTTSHGTVARAAEHDPTDG